MDSSKDRIHRKRAGSSLDSQQQQKDAPFDASTHEAFVTAANAISHLYSHSVKRLEEERRIGARDALRRLEACLPVSNADDTSIPTSELRRYIDEELHKIDME